MRFKEKSKEIIIAHPILIFFIAIAIRLPIAYISQGAAFDIESYAIIGSSVLRGNLNPYIYQGRYPYLPFWMFIEGGIVWIAYNTYLPFHFIAKIPSILFDSGIALILYQLLERKYLFWSLSYAVNPISLLITSGHGQFDSIPLFFLLLSLLLLKKYKFILSAISLSLGILAKIYPIFAIPFLINFLDNVRKKIYFIFIAASLPILTFIPYLILTPSLIFSNVLLYSSTPDFGYSAIIRSLHYLFTHRFELPSNLLLDLGKPLIVLAIVLLWYFKRYDLSVEEQLTSLFLLFYIFSSGISAQYLLWVVPFGHFIRSPMLKYYSLTGSGALLGFYLCLSESVLALPKDAISNTIAGIIYISFNTLWWFFCITWFLKIARIEIFNGFLKF